MIRFILISAYLLSAIAAFGQAEATRYLQVYQSVRALLNVNPASLQTNVHVLSVVPGDGHSMDLSYISNSSAATNQYGPFKPTNGVGRWVQPLTSIVGLTAVQLNGEDLQGNLDSINGFAQEGITLADAAQVDATQALVDAASASGSAAVAQNTANGAVTSTQTLSFDTLDDAISAPIDPVIRAYTIKGYHSAGDRCGGQFYIDTTSSEATNTGTIFPAASGRLKRIISGQVNVQWFGAIGDGIHDDYSAIMAAYYYSITNGAGVFFPSGVYNYDTPIKFDRSGSYFSGEGSATLRYSGSGFVTNAITVEGPDSSNFIYRIHFDNVNFAGSSKCTNLISLTSCAHVTMKNVRLFDCIDTALLVRTNVLGQFDSVSVSANELPSFVFTNTPYIGIKVQQCNSLVWNDVIIEGVSGPGILLTDHAINNVFMAGTSESNGTGIICTNFSNENTFWNMDIEENTNYFNVYVVSSWRNRFINGQYDAQREGSAPTGGIYVTNSQNTQIAANVASIYLDVGAENTDTQGSMIQNGGTYTDLGSNNERYHTVSTLTLTAFTNLLNPTIVRGSLNAPDYFSVGAVTGTQTDAADIYGKLGIIGPAGTGRQLYYGTGDTSTGLRWIIGAGATPESGGNAGSDFSFASRDDTGNALDTILTLYRSDGTVSLPAMTQGSIPYFGASGKIKQDNSGIFYDGTNHRVGVGTTTPWDIFDVYGGQLGVVGAAGTGRQIYLGTTDTQTGLRWILGANGTAESGANAGSDFSIISRNDSGGLISAPFTITRSSGAIAMPGAVTVGSVSGTGSGLTSLSAANISAGTLGTARGGTGTASTFTQGSMVFSGPSGVYAENSTYLFWNDTTHKFGFNQRFPDDLVDIYGQLGIEGNAGSARYINFGTSNTIAGLRWQIGATAGSESGTDHGSDFILASRTDSGALKSMILNIPRDTGIAIFTNSIAVGGIGSYATNTSMAITSTGTTNSTGMNQQAWLTAATGLTLKDSAGNAIFSGQSIVALTPVMVQPGGSFTGTAITSVGSHAF